MSEATDDIIEPIDALDTGATDPAPQEPEADATELEALAMGWKPKSTFKGDDSKFVDAAEYVRRGNTIMPFLRKELSGAYKKIETLEKAVAKSVEHMSRAEQRGHERALKEIQGRIDDAAAAGDVQGVRDAQDELVERISEVKAPAAPAEDPVFAAWKAENPWYERDDVMTAAAIAIGNKLFEEGYTGKAQAAEVTKRIKAKFPQEFENPARRQPSTVEGGGAPRRVTGKTYTDLPADAKAMCDDFVKDKIMTRDQYVKGYQW